MSTISPAVSVVVPLYNKETEVIRTTTSILSQTFADFELIIVDDGSSDASVDVVINTIQDDRVRLIQQSNSGVSAARNTGICAAQSDLVAFIDADDEWKPEFLSTIWELYRRFPEAGMYGTAYDRLLINNQSKPLQFDSIPSAPWQGLVKNYFETALEDTLICASAVAVRRTVFDEVGYFPVGIRMAEDLDMWMRIALKYPVAYSNMSAAVYNLTVPNQVTRQPRCNEHLIIADTAASAFARQEVPHELAADLREYVYWYQILAARRCAKAGKLILAQDYLKQSASTKRFRAKWLWWRFWTALPRPLFHLSRQTRQNWRFRNSGS